MLHFATLWLLSDQIFANPSAPPLKITKKKENQAKKETKPDKIFAIAKTTLWVTQGYISLHFDYSLTTVSQDFRHSQATKKENSKPIPHPRSTPARQNKIKQNSK